MTSNYKAEFEAEADACAVHSVSLTHGFAPDHLCTVFVVYCSHIVVVIVVPTLYCSYFSNLYLYPTVRVAYRFMGLTGTHRVIRSDIQTVE
jgi:hypothetical protein